MKITRKCPNCFQEIPAEERFCAFCGYDFRGGDPAGAPEAAAVPAAEEPAAAVPYDGPRYCPRGHDVPDPSLGFCPTCGAPLVNEPAEAAPEPYGTDPVPDIGMPEEAPERAAETVFHAPAEPRTCPSCGYVCDDPEMGFCPSCGMPFGAAEEPEYTEREREPVREALREAYREAPRIPCGMKPPTERDLAVKATYRPE